MANDKKFITRNGLSTQNIELKSSDQTKTISASMLDAGSLSFSGSAGQLFSITNSLLGCIADDLRVFPMISFDIYKTFERKGFFSETPSESHLKIKSLHLFDLNRRETV